MTKIYCKIQWKRNFFLNDNQFEQFYFFFLKLAQIDQQDYISEHFYQFLNNLKHYGTKNGNDILL